MPRILVTEPIADTGLEALRDAGHDVDVRLDLTPEALVAAVPGAHALIIRSATRVTDEVFEAGRELVVVGRAGTGVDNVDMAAATKRGVMVVNAPQSNSISAAEHTMALLLAQARHIPQAHAELKAGRWERARWEGIELHGKTLGVLGVGRIGALVAQRAHAFGMRIVAWDPFVAPERARQMGIQVMGLEELFGEADFVTVHLAKTKETTHLVDDELLAKAKPGLRIVNVARGGIIHEAALERALASGLVAGAALDVFATEPCTDSPLFAHDEVVVTPHLGSSTREAQDKAGVTIAEQVALALAGDLVPFALNVAAGTVAEPVRPYLPLAERLGRLFALLSGGVPPVLEITYEGEVAGHETDVLKLSVLKGVFGAGTEEPVSYVNAPQLAEERGVQVRESKTTSTQEYVSRIVIRGDSHSVAGILVAGRNEPRVVLLDDHVIEIPLAEHLVVVRNDDRVGMMALVTGVLAEHEVNIADMRLGRAPGGGTALAVITSDEPIPGAVRDRLVGQPGILGVHIVNGT